MASKKSLIFGFVFILLSSFIFATTSFTNSNILWQDINTSNEIVEYSTNKSFVNTGVTVTNKQMIYDNVNDKLNFGDNSAFDFGTTTDFTFNMWMNMSPTSLGTTEYFLTKQDVDPRYYLGYRGNTNLLIILLDDGSNVVSDQNTFNLESSEHMLTTTYDRNGNVTTWIDGVKIGSGTSMSTIGNLNNNNDFVLGNLVTDAAINKYDSFSAWNKLLTRSEIEELHSLGKTFNPYDLVSDFKLTAIDPYHTNASINSFTANITNTTTTTSISTTNSSVFYDYNKNVNISAYSSVYLPYSIYNINTSVNLEIALYKHKLVYPENNYIINDSENVTFQYNLIDSSNMVSCKLYVNDTLENTNTETLTNGLNDVFYEFTENGDYEWWVSCNDTESRHRFITLTNVTGPSIIAYSPSTNIVIDEGQTQQFSVTVSSSIKYAVSWFLDGVIKTTGVLWNWIVGGDEQGTGYNVTAIVNDTFGQTDSKTWNVNITNVNLAPVVNSIDTTVSTIFQNVDYYITCDISDSDTTSDFLNVSIQWSNDDVTWYILNSSYQGSDVWRSYVGVNTHEEDDVISYRCQGQDNSSPALTSSWYYLTDYKTIREEQIAPETPTVLLPKYNEKKYNIPVICTGAYDGQATVQDIFYEVYVRKNSSTWSLLRNQSEIVSYSYNIAEDGFNTTYDFKCRAYDGFEFSDYITVINATIKKDVAVFSIVATNDNPTYIKGKPYSQGYFLDLEGLGDNFTVYKVAGECNDDGIIDYVKDHNFQQKVKGSFNCINKGGNIEHEITAYIFKNDTSSEWGSACRELDPSTQLCKLSKKYEVYVYE